MMRRKTTNSRPQWFNVVAEIGDGVCRFVWKVSKNGYAHSHQSGYCGRTHLVLVFF